MDLAIYHKEANGWRVWVKNGILPLIQEEFCINNFITAAKVIYEAKGSEVRNDGKFLFDEAIRPVLKHVSCFSFYSESTLYVPYYLENTQEFQANPELSQTLTCRREMSQRYHYEVFKIFDQHTSPDYLLLNCYDSFPNPEVFDALYLGFFMQNQENWSIYYIPQGQLPSPSSISSSKGLIITGSCHCSYDLSHPWKQNLYDLISSYSQLGKCIIGICFGHQAICKSFNGQTSSNPSHHYTYSPQLSTGKANLTLMESHGDCVSLLPPSFQRLHTSPSCEVDSMEFGHKVLSFQSHPEYTLEFIKKFDSVCMRMTGSITDEQFEAIQAISQEFDSVLALEEINKYLRGKQNLFYL